MAWDPTLPCNFRMECCGFDLELPPAPTIEVAVSACPSRCPKCGTLVDPPEYVATTDDHEAAYAMVGSDIPTSA